jgi:hypothetical protein
MKITEVCITIEMVRGATAIIETAKRLRQKHFVHVTPAPVLSRFKGSHDRMLGLVEVLGRVLVFGRVTAADMTADEAFSQVDPGVAHLKAFFAAFAAGLDLANFLHVWTRCLCSCHALTPE